MDTHDIPALLREFGQHHCPEEPLYQRLCALLADSPQACAWLATAPPTQRKANLLLAAVHDQVLAAPSALGAWFASAGGNKQADAPGFAEALQAFLLRHTTTLAQQVQTRSTQTNEVGRCAVLWLVLQDLALARPRADHATPVRMALFDFGCSAGLNLGLPWMNFRLHQHGRSSGHVNAGLPQAPHLDCELIGPWPQAATAPTAFTLSHRAGVDPALIDVQEPEAVRWLQACLWPSDTARRQRLDAAVALARTQPAELQQASAGAACLNALSRWLAGLPADTWPIILNTWVLYYASAADLAEHRTAMQGLLQRYRATWVSAEDVVTTTTLFGPPPALAPVEDVGRQQAHTQTFWVTAEAGEAGLQARYVARSHPHGRWVRWDGPP